jgi:hypothetical protein
MRPHPCDAITPEQVAARARAEEIREATSVVTRSRQWIAVAASLEELVEARRTLARATSWLCNLNLQTSTVRTLSRTSGITC